MRIIKNKRTFSLFLTFLMLMGLLAAAPAMAVDIVQEIMVPNAGFEEVDENGWAKEWSHFNADASVAEFEIDSTRAYSGKNSLHIKATKNNPWAATTISGLVPGCFYELTMFINSNVTSSTWQATGNKLEFYSGRPSVETALADSSIPTTYPLGAFLFNTNDRWVEHKTIFHVPENTQVVKIYCRIYGQGEAWFDDLSVKFSGGPAKYAFDTDKVFHYKEETGGDAYVNIDPFYEGQGVEEDTLVDFTVYKGEEVCEKAENVKPVNMSARYTYSTSYMEPYERYTLKCKIKNAKGEVLEEYEQNLYVVDRPSMLSEDGYLMVDGKRFNPITAYHVDVEDYPKAAEGGINTVQFSWAAGRYEEQEYRKLVINTAKTNNLKGILSLYVANQNAGHPNNLENTKKVVEDIKDDDTIIALAMQDEPFINGDDKEKRLHAEEAYLAIRKIDKKHPIYICDKRNEYISVKYCDVLCIDAYAMGGDTRSISAETYRAREASKDKNGFWELAATYNSNGNFPTMNDARNSIYRAFEEGSTGMGYFAFSDAGQGVAERQQLYKWDLWEDFCKFNKEEAPILFDRFVNGNAVVFNEYDDGEGSVVGWDSMKWFNWFVGDDMYLVAHNRGRAEKSVTIPMRSRNGKIKIDGFKAEPLGLTTQKAISGNGEMTLTLGSEEVTLFKIIPDQKVDLSRINESSFDDLAGYEWAQDAIAALDAKNVLNTVAEGKYGPAEAITRLDFVSFLVRALGLTEEGEAFPDCDVKEIKIARRAGITTGDTDGNFRPNDTITRQDIMTTAARAVKAAATEKEIPTFSDWSFVSDYALDAVKAMVQAEVIVGNGDGTLNPLGLATRAEAAVMLHRILHTEFEAAAPVPETPQEVKEEITFTDAVSEDTLSVWSDATDLLNALGVSTPLLEKSVSKGEFEKAIEGFIGMPFDVFADDLKAITYAEAVEELVKLLGYEAYALSRGGYMVMATQLDLLKGLSPEEYIRAGELAVLLKNAADIKMAERTVFGGNEEYRESEDTLLSSYRNIYKVKGTVEETYYTGANVRRGEILLDGVVYTGGEEYHRQRVEAYAEYAEDEKKILYIEPANGAEAITIDADDILEADTSKIRYDLENGKDELVSVTGAAVYVNGEKKTVPQASDLRPEMGTVTLISSGGAVTSVLVEKYENRIVQSVYKDDNTVYFKNAKELVLEKDKGRFYMDFEVGALKEWNVLSVYLHGDGSLYKVALSAESAQGEPAEISADGILLGDKVYPVAKTCLGTPALGISAKYYLDFSGKVAAVDDKNVTPEYGYLTKIAADKGVDGGVSLKIFTKTGEMKVFKAAETVRFNSTPTNAAALLTESILMDGENTKEQLVIYEINGEEKITSVETAADAVKKNFADIPEGFSKVFYTGDVAGATSLFSGYNMMSFACLYRIGSETVSFIVPEKGSENAKDYSVVKGGARYAHSVHYVGCELFDWHEDYTVGAVVQRVSSTVKDVSVDAPMAMVVGVGDGLDAEGNIRKAVRLVGNTGTEMTFYADEDLRVVLDANTLTDIKNGETEVTVKGYITSLNPDMPVSALNKGDIVQFSVGGMDGVTFTGMRAVLRSKSPLVGENAPKNLGPDYNYSERTVAFGPVVRTVPDGVVLLPGQYERLFLHYYQSGGIAPVLIYDSAKDIIEVKTIEAIRKDDMVFCRRLNPYLELYAVYR
ncbi:MAG: S-layer homology domain-containing protein [Ruminococcaceae bacterium]|nr:S-layer homology domain-containing protein [Oscillospiraceae bacterium]